MFKANWTEETGAQYQAIRAKAAARKAAREARGRQKSTKDEGLFKQVKKTIDLLLSNPRHPGLSTHEYRSLEHPYDSDGRVFEAYAQHRRPGAYRVFWCYGPGKREITVISITLHP